MIEPPLMEARGIVDTKPLGKLENLVMEALWEKGEGTVREVWRRVGEKERAYTTIMTTLNRLFQKGLLERVRDGNAFRYRPVQDRDTHHRKRAEAVMEKLLTAEGEVALTAFVDAASAQDEQNLRRLAELIRKRMTERNRD